MIVKRPPGLTDEHAGKVAAKFAKFVGLGFQQDVEIWTHKSRIDNPLLCADDGPVYQLRRWYEQFYTDVEDITPEMTARYEFEIDTTRAVADWEDEVAANLAQREAGPARPGPAEPWSTGGTRPAPRRWRGQPRGVPGRRPADDRHATLREVACDRCAATVLVDQVQPAAHERAVEPGGGPGLRRVRRPGGRG